jgi:hypothetical protein
VHEAGLFWDMASQIKLRMLRLKWAVCFLNHLLKNKQFMVFLIKILVILIVAVFSLLIGGWIATRMIKMDRRINLIDW